MLSDVLLRPENLPDRGDDTSGPLTRIRSTSPDVMPVISTEPGLLWSEPSFLPRGGGAKVVTNELGVVLWRSAGAALLGSNSRCVTISNGELCGRTRHSDTALRKLLGAAAAGHQPLEELLASSPSDAPQLYVQARSCIAGGSRVIAVTIRELDRDLDAIPDLCRLYGLTRAEQEITRKMLQGHSVAEIAAELNKAELTVRTHIKRLYVKLNVRTKEQLFAIILKLMVD